MLRIGGDSVGRFAREYLWALFWRNVRQLCIRNSDFVKKKTGRHFYSLYKLCMCTCVVLACKSGGSPGGGGGGGEGNGERNS